MHLLKVAAAALNTTPLDWEGNRSTISAAIDSAREMGASLLCLPEMCITGYNCEDMFQSPGVLATAWEMLEEITAQTRGMVVSVGLPLLHQGRLFNCCGLLADGEIRGFVAKRHLAGDGIHYEPRWFCPWPMGRRAQYERGGRSYPLGDVLFECGGRGEGGERREEGEEKSEDRGIKSSPPSSLRVGFEICRDAWVAERPGSEMFRLAADVILNPSASHFAFGKQEIRRRFVLEGSRAFGVSYIYSNLLGNEAGRAIYDGDAMIASGGKLLATQERFSFSDGQVISAVIDIDLTRMQQAKMVGTLPDVECPADAIVKVPFDWTSEERGGRREKGKGKGAPTESVLLSPPSSLPAPLWETSGHLKEEEFTRAVRLALFDYLRKSKAQGFVVSLSGGADSAAVACLVAEMVEAAIRELGVDGFQRKLEHVAGIQSCKTAHEFVRKLLTCVYQSTRNSSQTTRHAARQVTEEIGAEFIELDVDPQVEAYTRLVETALGRSLTWKADDTALQNIQARARVPGLWMITNVQRALLLATSNRSEAAVGYTTMDGDTAGGLSPIAGIDKAFLRRWLKWMETSGPQGGRPLPGLAAVNVQPPTAELRPPSEAQTDEGDLMPYDLLDAIERAAIRDKRTPLEVFVLIGPRFAQIGSKRLAVYVERFFTLWCRNQWKRERYAPSFHLDDENLDPKSWCRFPILSGGFERELAELRAAVENG